MGSLLDSYVRARRHACRHAGAKALGPYHRSSCRRFAVGRQRAWLANPNTRLSTNARIAVLYTKDKMAWSSTIRRIRGLDTTMSET